MFFPSIVGFNAASQRSQFSYLGILRGENCLVNRIFTPTG